MDRTKLLTKLLETGHLNQPERLDLGTSQIGRLEIAQIVSGLLERGRFFPPGASPFQPGLLVYEGAILEKLEARGYRVHVQRADPLDPSALAEQMQRDFADFEDALSYFETIEWPQGIDGVKISR